MPEINARQTGKAKMNSASKDLSIKSICVFCGSSLGIRPEYRQAAKELGNFLASQQIRLIYGGASVGLMGAVADAVLEAGGEVTGVIPQFLMRKEVAHASLIDLRVVPSMHERKTLMAELSDAFIALPGGFGTFEELCEIITWSQLGLHQKPIGLLNVCDYYRPLLTLFDQGITEGFIRSEHRAGLSISDSPLELLQALMTGPPEN